MPDLIYKIYTVWLYDNQLNSDYLILCNRQMSYYGTYRSELPYCIINIQEKTIDNISKTCFNNNMLFIENKNYLTLKLVDREYTDERYKIYDIYWNETKSGVNIFDFEICNIFRDNKFTSYSNYLIYESSQNRDIELRNNKLTELFL